MSDTDRPDKSPEGSAPKSRSRRDRAATSKAEETREGPAEQVTSEDPAIPSDPSPAQAPEPAVGEALREEQASSPWHGPEQNTLPPRPSRAGLNRLLAIAALLLSILLPGALYAYLAATGVFDRDPARMAQLESSIETLRATPAPKPEVSRADFDKLAARVDQLERAVAAQGERLQSAPAAGSTARLDSVAAQIQAASRDAKDALALARTAADSANSTQSAATRLVDAEKKLVAIEKRLAALEQSVSARPRQDENAPSILVMARAIEADLNSGAAYAGELDALARLGAEPKLIEALRPFAEKGAPSASSLAAEFEAELDAARKRVAGTAQPENLWDRFRALIGQIVRVRRIGAHELGSPAGTVEAALLRNDIAAAHDAWEGLPVFEKSATAASGAHIKALADAQAAARQISTIALDAIRRSSSTDNGG
jgi:hypothetical protein